MKIFKKMPKAVVIIAVITLVTAASSISYSAEYQQSNPQVSGKINAEYSKFISLINKVVSSKNHNQDNLGEQQENEAYDMMSELPETINVGGVQVNLTYVEAAGEIYRVDADIPEKDIHISLDEEGIKVTKTAKSPEAKNKPKPGKKPILKIPDMGHMGGGGDSKGGPPLNDEDVDNFINGLRDPRVLEEIDSMFDELEEIKNERKGLISSVKLDFSEFKEKHIPEVRGKGYKSGLNDADQTAMIIAQVEEFIMMKKKEALIPSEETQRVIAEYEDMADRNRIIVDRYLKCMRVAKSVYSRLVEVTDKADPDVYVSNKKTGIKVLINLKKKIRLLPTGKPLK